MSKFRRVNCNTIARLWVIGLIWLLPALARAADLDALAGRYVYDESSLTFPSGAVVDLQGLGVRDAELTIFPDGILVSRLTMTSGESVVSKAQASEVQLNGDRGSWVEHWPELGYPVRREIQRTANGFSYQARFDDRRDALRYGSIDRGVLRRVGDVDERDRAARVTTTADSLPRVPLSADEARQLGERMAGQVRAESAARPAGERETRAFFTEPDLAELGCTVAAGLGQFKDLSAPGIPGARVFTLTSRSGCAVELFNLIQKSDGAPGLWAGLRAQAAGDARRRGYATEERAGRLGERSELRVFTQDGAYRGFWYAIESGNVLYVLRIYSERVPVSPELETLLREKLALASD
ncbi:hypothetical protein [Candidatus Thiodictyon syntrophicum]|uniref:Uncharacterized protein n=1 Tax=Candidatus Thiodictyon syntrophicum TaxID=1166950 RepID=A0A2K8UJ23_9GAMM|nr:hypothetical protein [Candidatus Thiodictyon syntrophicum]AUB85540.1 hypothetical protein THSYN_32010 [Candidatus Thiodictyon syntrophicum]